MFMSSCSYITYTGHRLALMFDTVGHLSYCCQDELVGSGVKGEPSLSKHEYSEIVTVRTIAMTNAEANRWLRRRRLDNCYS